jgi:hypothetical protein
MIHSHRYVEVEVRVHTQDHLDQGVRSFGAHHRHVRKLLSMCSGHFPPEEQERADDTVRSDVRGELL